MRKVYIYADPGLLIEKIDPQSGNYYRASEVDAHLAALQAQHAEALAEMRIALEEHGIRQRRCNRCGKAVATTSNASVVYCSLDCAD